MPDSPRDLRVLILTNVPAPYRLELFNLVHGHFGYFAVAFQFADEPGRYWDMRPKLPYPTVHLGGLTLPVGSRRIRINRGLGRLLDDVDPDIVVAGGFSPTVALLANLCRRQRRALVLLNDGTVHTDPMDGPEFHYRRWLASQAIGFLAASGPSKEYFRRLGIPGERIATVQLTCDLQSIARHVNTHGARERARSRWGVGSKVLCYVGRLIPGKRPLDVLDAYASACRSVDDLWLLFAGDGELRGRIEARVRREGLNRVRMLGHLGWNDLMDVYAASDVNLLLSVQEAYGMVVIEALAAGLPVISTPVVGAAVDLIRSGENGHLIPPGDTESAAEAIRSLLANPNPDGVRAAARRVIEEHDVRREADRFVTAMERFAGEWRKPSTTDASHLRVSPGHSRRDVVVVTRILAPYRAPLLRDLERAGIRCGVVLAGRPDIGDMEASGDSLPVGIPVLKCRGTVGWRADVLDACAELAPSVLLIEHGARLDFTWTLLLSRRFPRAKRVLWTHGVESEELYSGRPGPGSPGRWLQLSLGDGLLCYDVEMSHLLARRFPHKVVGVAPNSTDGQAILDAFRNTSPHEREALKEALGLRRRFYLLGLGRLVARKRFGQLIRILQLVRHGVPDTGLVLIGGGPERSSLGALTSGMGFREGDDVVFAGELSDQAALARWLLCADVHVSPNYVGLNVVDALFAGLPTVLSAPGRRGPYHGPEWKYLRECKGGLFATGPSNQELAQRAADYLSLSEGERRQISEACVAYASSHLGLEAMVRGIREVLTAVKQVPPREPAV